MCAQKQSVANTFVLLFLGHRSLIKNKKELSLEVYMLDSEINVRFLLNKRGDLYLLLHNNPKVILSPISFFLLSDNFFSN